MNIAFLTTSFFPASHGGSVRVAGLCEALAALGHRVTIFVPGRVKRTQIYRPGITVFEFPISNGFLFRLVEKFFKFHPGRYFAFRRFVLPEILKNGFSVVHSRQPLDLFLFGRLCRRKEGLRWVTEVHKFLGITDAEDHTLPRFLAKFAVFNEKWLMNQSDCVVTMTPSGMETLRTYGVHAPIVAVSNSSSLQQHSGRSPVSFVRGKKYLLYAGTIRPVEGLDLLIEAFALVKQRDSSFQLLIVGGGDSALLQRLCGTLGIVVGKDVHFLGEIPYAQMGSLYQQANLFIFPRKPVTYHRDIIGVKIYDALAAGLPIATVDYGELGRMIREHELGVCAATFSAEAFADEIVHFLSDPHRYETIRKKVRAFGKHLSWRHSGKALLTAYGGKA